MILGLSENVLFVYMCVRGVPSNKIFRVNLWKKITFCAASLFSMHWARAQVGSSSNAMMESLIHFDHQREYKQSDQYFGLETVQSNFRGKDNAIL